jgi:serine/threonine-protein kinase
VVDRRADVYGLGVLLYQLVTGEAPLPGVVLSPLAKRPDLPESVEKVILKAMAQNPDARFQSARAFQDALESSIRPIVPAGSSVSPGVSSQSVESATPPPPAPKKTNWAAIILGVFLVVVICIGMVWIFNWWSNQSEETPVEPTSPPAEIIPTEAPEPTQPPELPSPTVPPEEPPEIENPIETPDDGVNLPEICNSGGFAGGFFFLGGLLLIRKHWRVRKRKDYGDS